MTDTLVRLPTEDDIRSLFDHTVDGGAALTLSLVNQLKSGVGAVGPLANALAMTFWLSRQALPPPPSPPDPPAYVDKPQEREKIRAKLDDMRKQIIERLENPPTGAQVGLKPMVARLAEHSGRWFHTLLGEVPAWAITVESAADEIIEQYDRAVKIWDEKGKTNPDDAAKEITGCLDWIQEAVQQVHAASKTLADHLNGIVVDMRSGRADLSQVQDVCAPMIGEFVRDIRSFIEQNKDWIGLSAGDALPPTANSEEGIKRLEAFRTQILGKHGELKDKIDQETKTLIGFGAGGAVMMFLTLGVFSPAYIAVMAGVGGDRLVQYDRDSRIMFQNEVLGYEINLGAFIGRLPAFVQRLVEVLAAAEQSVGGVLTVASDVESQAKSLGRAEGVARTRLIQAHFRDKMVADRMRKGCASLKEALHPLRISSNFLPMR